MQGHVEFRHRSCNKKDQLFNANVNPFILALKPGIEMVDSPYFKEWMNSI
jgi:hypothetical protein